MNYLCKYESVFHSACINGDIKLCSLFQYVVPKRGVESWYPSGISLDRRDELTS